MNDTHAPGLPRTVRRMLDRYRRRWRFVTAHRGLFLTLGLLLACVGVSVGADRLLRTPRPLRAAILGVLAAAFVVCVVRLVFWRVARRVSDRNAAARLGRRFPDVQEDLVTAVELSRNGGSGNGVSPALVRSALSQIETRAATVDPRAAVPLKPMLRAALVLLLVAAVLGAAYWSGPAAVQNALRRLFLPDRDVAFFSYTRLTVAPGDLTVREGDTVELLAMQAGRQVGRARLDARNEREALSPVLTCTAGRAVWTSPPLFDDLRYRFVAGDAISDWHHIRVVPAPSVAGKSAELTLPAYAGGARRVVDPIQGPLEIVEGTSVVIRAAPVARGDDDRFGCEGTLVVGDQRRAMRLDGDGRLCSAAFTPRASGEYTIHLRDGFGLESRSPDSLFIKVLPDRRPRVTITDPGRDVVALPGESLKIAASAVDDLGVRRLSLRYRLIEHRERDARPGRWRGMVLNDDGGPERRDLDGEAVLALADLGVRPGMSLEYQARASDYKGDEPYLRQGASAVYRVIVLSELEHLELTLKRLQGFQIELLRAAAKQESLAKQIGKMAEGAERGDGAAKTGEKAAEAERRENELARTTEAAARKLESLIPELARNPKATPQQLSDLERMARAVRSVARGGMSQASKSLNRASRAQQGQQAQQGANLRSAQKSGDEAAKQLRRLAEMLARLRRRGVLERLAIEAERLAGRQTELKAASVPLALKTLGATIEDLDDPLKTAVMRLAEGERHVKTGIDRLDHDIEDAAQKLAFAKPEDADKAEKANERLRTDKTAAKAADLAEDMARNVLLASRAMHDAVAVSLTEVATILRGAAEDMEQVAKELDAFIRRQREINTGIEQAIARHPQAPGASALGIRQARLGRDVAEQAAALLWLAQELPMFESKTAVRLDLASEEMKEGVHDLFRPALPEALEHGRKALALLEEARQKFKDERPQMESACQQCRSMKAVLLLFRILAGQKELNRDTLSADKGRPTVKPDAFARRAVALAERQSGLRLDAKRLEKMLAQFKAAAKIVQAAGGKMDVSRLALQGADTGEETRIVQRQVIALLEQLLKDGGKSMGMSGGLGAMRTMAMKPGMSGGGFAGGSNAPLLPAAVSDTGDTRWRRARSRFEGVLKAGFEGQYPPEFRDLLNAYFDRLRKEPPR